MERRLTSPGDGRSGDGGPGDGGPGDGGPGDGGPGDVVRIDFRKYPDTAHWWYDTHRLAEDDHGTWLWAPRGTMCARGSEPATPAEALFVTLVPRQAWWCALWNDRAALRCTWTS